MRPMSPYPIKLSDNKLLSSTPINPPRTSNMIAGTRRGTANTSRSRTYVLISLQPTSNLIENDHPVRRGGPPGHDHWQTNPQRISPCQNIQSTLFSSLPMAFLLTLSLAFSPHRPLSLPLQFQFHDPIFSTTTMPHAGYT